MIVTFGNSGCKKERIISGEVKIENKKKDRRGLVLIYLQREGIYRMTQQLLRSSARLAKALD